jgi:hypothetical protein
VAIAFGKELIGKYAHKSHCSQGDLIMDVTGFLVVF